MREVEYCTIYFTNGEYVALSWQNNAIEEIEKSNNSIRMLGELGKRGWELVSSSLNNNDTRKPLHFLKRITREHVTAYR